MISLLFVDDEPKILDGLRRMLFDRRGDWDMRFSGVGAAALSALADWKADVVISDMRMPGIDGVALLSQIELLYPQTARIMLTGQSWHEAGLRLAGPSQIFLPKPCDGACLQGAVLQAMELRAHLGRPGLREALVPAQNEHLLPLYYEIRNELLLEEPSAEVLASTIARDPGFEGAFLSILKALHPVAGRGVREKLASLTPDIFRPLILGTAIWAIGLGRQIPLHAETKRLLSSGRRVAELGTQIAGAHGLEADTRAIIFLAGLLHNLGACPGIAPEGVEAPDAAGYLLAEWGLPDALVEAVTFQDCPSRRLHPQSPALAILCIAKKFAALPATAWGEACVDQEFLKKQGISLRVEAYRKAVSKQHQETGGQND